MTAKPAPPTPPPPKLSPEIEAARLAPVLLGGFWVPSTEVWRFEDYRKAEGVLDLDVGKAVRAVEYCRGYRRALDVGAHIGAVSRFLSTRFDRVEAFEPIPQTFACLARNAADNPAITAHEMAASDREEALHFEFLPFHSQLSHAVREGEAKHFGDDKTLIVGPIEARPLDSFGFDDVDFIKIDVEGAEINVVRGLEATIRTCRPVIMVEQAENEAKYHGHQPHEASDFLVSLGMQRVEWPYLRDRLFVFSR